MVNSVTSNMGAMAALQSLNSTTSSLTSMQGRVSTGHKVTSAVDDGAAYAISQSLQQSMAAVNSTNQNLAAAKGVVDTAEAATTKISSSLQSMRSVLVGLSNESLDSAKKTELQDQYKNLAADINKTIESSTSSGFNALSADKQKVNVNTSGGDTIEIGGEDLKAKLALPTEINSAAAAKAMIDPNNSAGIGAAEKQVADATGRLGSASRRISAQINFNGAMQDALKSSFGAINDADLTKESAGLQALQVRQQLGVQSLSIANQAPQSLLSLFRG